MLDARRQPRCLPDLEIIVIGPVVLTTCIGAISYLWLTAVTLPVSMGIRATFQGGGWRGALPITFGLAGLTAAIPTAAIVLLTMTDPSLVYVLDTTGLRLGLVTG